MNGAIVRWQASTVSDERRRHAIELFSTDERARWEASPTREAADRFLAGRMLLRELVAETLQVPLAAIAVSAECSSCGGPHGRPEISVGGRSVLHASLSHTAGLVAAAVLPVSAGAAIGVDVEAVSGSRERLEAIEELVPGGGTGSTRSTLHRWTRVEAVLKADGRGLRVDPGAVTVHEAAGRLAGSVTGSDASYALFDRSIGRTAVLSVAVALAAAVSDRMPQAEPAARSRTARR